MIDLSKLERGDIVTHLGSGESYVVIRPGHGEMPAVGVRHVLISNASEWKVYSKSLRVEPAQAGETD